MEMSDEPERYRRTYIAEVPGTLRKEHPFELWLINHGHELASNDLLFAIFTAKYSADEKRRTFRTPSTVSVPSLPKARQSEIFPVRKVMCMPPVNCPAPTSERNCWKCGATCHVPSSARRTSRCSFPMIWVTCTTTGAKMKAPSSSDSKKTLPTRSICSVPTTVASWCVFRTFPMAASSSC